MQYSEAKQGRVFIIKLDGGEKIPDVLEEFARNQGIERAYCFLVGGIDDGSRIIVGPEREMRKGRPVPIEYELEGVHEVLGQAPCFRMRKGIRYFTCISRPAEREKPPQVARGQASRCGISAKWYSLNCSIQEAKGSSRNRRGSRNWRCRTLKF